MNLVRSLALLSLLGILAVLASCDKENQPPVASFTIDPATGNELTIFYFDASASSDKNDKTEDLVVMWDWEGDGRFDTPFAAKKTADHKYSQPGEYQVTLVVKDPRGLTDTLSLPLLVTSSNLPPDPPSNPNPADGNTTLTNKPWLKWDCHDPDGDAIIFTCFFGTTNPPPQFSTNQMYGTIQPGDLEYGTTYYWKINARDVKGNTSEGPVWSFQTIDLHFSTLTDNRDGQTYTTIQVGTDWWMAENLRYETESGSYCYENSDVRCNTYGKLYTWDAAMNACPDGWHLPTLNEFHAMVHTLGGVDSAGGKLKDTESMLWKEPNTGATNISGFGALPAGRRYDQGEFAGVGYYAQFFSSTEYNSQDAYNLTLGYDYASTFIYNYRKSYAISVRCVKDK